ncbi:hypothetical protein QNM99_22160 [Pseudomonas sp. PCH446]
MTAKNVVTAVFHFPADYRIPAKAETRITLRNRCNDTLLGPGPARNCPTSRPGALPSSCRRTSSVTARSRSTST